MAKIPLSQRQVLPPGGSQVEGPSSMRVSLAGQTGRNLQGVGNTISEIGFAAQRANDASELANTTLDMQRDWQEAQVELNKELDPGEYQAKANKALKDITGKAQVGFRNKNKFGLITKGMQLDGEKSITLNFMKKTSDNTKMTLDKAELAMSDAVLAGTFAGSLKEAKALIANMYTEAVGNLAIDQEYANNHFVAFEQSLSMESFKRDLITDPKTMAAKSLEELQKDYGLSGVNATKAKVAAFQAGGKNKVKMKSLKSSLFTAIEETGNFNAGDMSTVIGNLEGRDLEDFTNTVANSKAIFADKQMLEKMTSREAAVYLSQIEKNIKDVDSKYVHLAKRRFELAEKVSRVQEDLKETDPYKSQFESGTIGEVVSPLRFQSTVDMARDNLVSQATAGILPKDRRVAPKETLGRVDGRVIKGTTDMINEFVKGNTDQRNQQLKDLKEEYGEYTSRLYKQLLQDGMPKEAGLMMSVNDELMRRKIGAVVNQSRDTIKKALGDDKLAGKISESLLESKELNGFINSMQPFNPTQKASFRDVIEKVGLQMAVEGMSKGDIVKTLVEKKLSSDLYQYSGNTLRIRRENGWDKETIEPFLALMQNERLVQDMGILRGDVLEPFVPRQLSTGKWYTNGDESTARFYIEGVPAVKELEDGSYGYVEFSFDEIMANGVALQFNESTGFNDIILSDEAKEMPVTFSNPDIAGQLEKGQDFDLEGTPSGDIPVGEGFPGPRGIAQTGLGAERIKGKSPEDFTRRTGAGQQDVTKLGLYQKHMADIMELAASAGEPFVDRVNVDPPHKRKRTGLGKLRNK